MSWVRIDDHFYDHPKWATAPGDSIALWLAAMAWCNRNESYDGFIPLSKLGGLVQVRNVKRTATDLCKRHAFLEQGDGYLIHEYAKYQQNEKVRKIREARSVAGRKGASVRWGKNGSEIANGIASAIANGWQTDSNENAPQTTDHRPLDYISTDNNSPSDLPSSSSLSDEERTDRRTDLAQSAANALAATRTDLKRPGGWIRRTTEGLLRERLADIDRCIDQGYSRETAMDLLTTDPVTQPAPLQPAWHADPNCDMCPGDGWVKDDDGCLRPCACQRVEPYPTTKKRTLGIVK